MEENIQDIKRNLEEIKKDLKIASDKSKAGIPVDSEIFFNK